MEPEEPKPDSTEKNTELEQKHEGLPETTVARLSENIIKNGDATREEDAIKLRELRKQLGIVEIESQQAVASSVEKGRESAEKEKDGRDLLMTMRLSQRYPTKPFDLTAEDARMISQGVAITESELKHNYVPSFGVVPSGRGEGPYASQVYARDLAHAAGNILASKNPQALIDSYTTIFKYQKPDGMLPLRVERSFQATELWGPARAVGRWLFKAKGDEQRPAYEGSDFGFSGSEDTVPATIVGMGELFINSEDGRTFVKENFAKLEQAIKFFETKIDLQDGLAVITRKNSDWADSLIRKGKLGGINVWWARSLRMMEFMSKQLGQIERAQQYAAEYKTVKKSVLEKLYNADEGYFRAAEGEDRVDTVASIFGALYLLTPEKAVKVEETLAKRVTSASGLRNFDPPYPQSQISEIHRLWGWAGKIMGSKVRGYNDYHNNFSWPWVTLENIQVKIKIALQHQDESVRNKYKQEAIDDLIRMSRIFEQAGGYREILDPDNPRSSEIYGPPMSKNLMGTMAAYQAACTQLEKLGWIAI